MVTSNSRKYIIEGTFVNWLFTDSSISQLEVSLTILDGDLKTKQISKEFHEHYRFMFNTKIKKLKLLETLNK